MIMGMTWDSKCETCEKPLPYSDTDHTRCAVINGSMIRGVFCDACFRHHISKAAGYEVVDYMTQKRVWLADGDESYLRKIADASAIESPLRATEVEGQEDWSVAVW